MAIREKLTEELADLIDASSAKITNSFGIAEYLLDANYRRIPKMGTKRYDTLMEDFVNLVLELDSDLKYANARGAASRNLFHRFIESLTTEPE
jgi:hypothetical protein